MNHGLMGAGENEAARFSICIDDTLQIAEKLRYTLNFIQDRTFLETVKKPSRVGNGLTSNIWVFQRNIRPLGEGHLCQGRLTRLSRAENRYCGILCRTLPQFMLYLARNHAGMISRAVQITSETLDMHGARAPASPETPFNRCTADCSFSFMEPRSPAMLGCGPNDVAGRTCQDRSQSGQAFPVCGVPDGRGGCAVATLSGNPG